MLTPAQLAAENFTDPLTDTQILNLLLLVRQYGPYQKYAGRWPNIETKLAAEKTTPTELTLALKAVLTALGNLPEIDAESQGSEGEPGYFSVKRNWDILAQDVLDTMYIGYTWVGPETVAVSQTPVGTLRRRARSRILDTTTGREF